MTENPPVEVTQADRDAAADMWIVQYGGGPDEARVCEAAERIRVGEHDDIPLVQKFAQRAASAIAAFVADARKYPGYLREGVGASADGGSANETELWRLFRNLCTPATAWHDVEGWKQRADAFALALAPAQPSEAERIDADWCLRMAEAEGDAEIGAGAPDHPLRCPPVEADAGLAGETDRDFENGFRAGVDFYICHPKATEREIDAAIIEELRSWKKWRRLTPTAATPAPDPLQPGRYPNTPLGEQQRPFGESFDGFKMLREHFAQPDALEPLRVGWVQLENGRFSISITKAELDAFRDALTAIAALSPTLAQVRRLTLERDEAQSMFDRHVEWASDQAAQARRDAIEEAANTKPPRSAGRPPNGMWGGYYQDGWDHAVIAYEDAIRTLSEASPTDDE